MFDFQLLGMPREIRDKIFRYVSDVGENIPLHLRKCVTGTAMHRTTEGAFIIAETREHWCAFDSILESGLSRVFIHTMRPIPLSATCKQCHEEVSILFYAQNTFSGRTPFEKMDLYGVDLCNKLTTNHMGLIKNLDVYFSGQANRATRAEIDEFVIVMINCFPGLRKLSLSSSLVQYRTRSFVADAAEKARDLLVVSAEITQFHAILKKAIWTAESGGFYPHPRELYNLDTYSMRFRIDIVSVRIDEEIFQHTQEKCDIDRNKIISKVCEMQSSSNASPLQS